MDNRADEVDKNALKLQNALSWYAHVINVAETEEGRPVSYGATYVTDKPVTRIATVSAGYADGYPRLLSNKGRVLINGKYAPVIGRICMDQVMIDVTSSADRGVDICRGDEVIFIGRSGDETLSAEEVAQTAGTINYEITCSIGSRVPRRYLF